VSLSQLWCFLTLAALLQSMHVLNNPEVYGIIPGSADEIGAINELMEEVVMLSGIHCDRIVSFRGLCVGTLDKRPKYIILELASGSLDWYLRSLPGQLPLTKFVGMCKDILNGLNYMHSQVPPMMHRDLKPANILVFIDGGGVYFKIGDVGLAKCAIEGRLAGSKAGTAYYMPPEVSEGSFDHRIDMFSFGVMMAEIVVRKVKPEVERLSVPGLDMRARGQMVNEAIQYLKSEYEPLATMVEGCCARNPETRMSASDALSIVRSIPQAALVCLAFLLLLAKVVYRDVCTPRVRHRQKP
jgi:serine/threonine protein kinase